jgi:hypothetical protein
MTADLFCLSFNCQKRYAVMSLCYLQFVACFVIAIHIRLC